MKTQPKTDIYVVDFNTKTLKGIMEVDNESGMIRLLSYNTSARVRELQDKLDMLADEREAQQKGEAR